VVYNHDAAMQDLSEICHSVVVTDNNVNVAIFVFDEISSTDCVRIEDISRGIYTSEELVKCGTNKGNDRMVMCGWRRDLGKKKG